MRHGGARWGVTLRRPLARGPPSCTLGNARGSLALRGGADSGQGGGGANELALAQVTDCKVLVAALMSSDNDERAAAEKRYDALKAESPDATSTALIKEVSIGAEEERAMAAVLARSAVPEMWEKLSDQSKTGIKQQLLMSLEAETSPNMARKLANVVGAISFAVRDGGWPDLIPAMVAMCNSDVAAKKEMAYHVLAILPHQIGDEIKKHFPQLSVLYEQALTSTDSNVHVSGFRAISSYLSMCDTPKELKPLQAMLPAMLAAVGTSLQTDEANARSLLDTMIEIASMNPRFFKPQLKEIAAAMLEHVAMNKNLEASTRRLALELLVEVAERGPGMIKKVDGLIQQLVAVSFALMVESVDAAVDFDAWVKWEDKGEDAVENENDDQGDEDQADNFDHALECLDRLAVALGGAKMMPELFVFIPEFLQHADWRYRLAALYGVSQTCEGCYKEMKKHLAQVVPLVMRLLNDEHARVRWAAINCLGQLATDLGPLLQQQFHQDVMPALTLAMSGEREPVLRVRAHAAAASINFCEHADAELLKPYLQPMLLQLASLMQTQHRKATQQAVTSVAAIALAIGDVFEPYYHEFMPRLTQVLTLPPDQVGGKMRGKTLECISLVGVAVGPEIFREDAKRTMQLIVSQMQELNTSADDPQINYMHQACGRICRALKKEFVPYLPSLLPALLHSVATTPDMKVADEDAEDADFEGMETVQVGEHVMGIKTSALEEKATACHMLVVYLEELEDGFFPYLEQVGKELKPLLTFWYHEDVRSSAMSAMPLLCRSAASFVRNNNADASIVQQVLGFVFPALVQTLILEPEVAMQAQCVRAVGRCAVEVQSAISGPSLSSEQLSEATKALKQLLQDSDERLIAIVGGDGYDDEEDEQDEEDSRNVEDEEAIEAEEDLLEQIIYTVGKLLETQGEIFHIGLDEILEWFFAKFDQAAHVSQKRLAMAMLDDVMEAMAKFPGAGDRYVASFMPHMLLGAMSTDMELRQAALFGLGLCAQHGGAGFAPYRTEATQTLMHVLSQQDARSKDKESGTDNAAASLGKIAQFQPNPSPHDPQGVPTAEELFGSWLAYLPLTSDLQESTVVNKQLSELVERNHGALLGVNNVNLPRIMSVFAEVLETEMVEEETTLRIQTILRAAQAAAAAQLQQSCRAISAEGVAKLQRAIAGTSLTPAAVAAAAAAAAPPLAAGPAESR